MACRISNRGKIKEDLILMIHSFLMVGQSNMAVVGLVSLELQKK